MNIVIIPSKKNSFRLKNKNTKKINNLPAIIITIKNLIRSDIFSKIIVSSDDIGIVNLLKYYKLNHKVEFFKRSANLCKNKISTRDVILDVIKKMSIKSKDIVTCVYPDDVKNKVNKIKNVLDSYIFPIKHKTLGNVVGLAIKCKKNIINKNTIFNLRLIK